MARLIKRNIRELGEAASEIAAWLKWESESLSLFHEYAQRFGGTPGGNVYEFVLQDALRSHGWTLADFKTEMRRRHGEIMSDCPHLNFNAYVDVNRIQKSDDEPGQIVAYTADVRVSCRECGQPFEFFGLPNGMSFYRPTVSINGQEMRVPLVLPGTRPPEGMAGFSVTAQIADEQPAVKQ